ncbi:MAG: PhoPQ-activated pathogenicity-related family protein [Terracidiphilus sp.]|nr:PhoPQ-activated pathogenicity-related family protein [Terracidiphilus sp.]
MNLRRMIRVLFCLLCLLPMAAGAQVTNHKTALDAYVNAPDNHYQYTLVESTPHPGYTVNLIRMVSQEWRSSAEVNQSVWKHWMEIYVPDQVSSSIGMLYITGGATTEVHPKPDLTLAAIATGTHSVVSVLLDVPNQPLIFANDPYGPRKEDEIIAYTWRKFLDTGDANWPLRLPMTKAAVRAMDTVTSFTESKEGGGHRVDHFFVMGASKRGWTTWTTAAVDPRVVAIAPMVIDVLNVVPSFKHHYRTYGFWAPSVGNYYQEHLMDELDNPDYLKLMAIEDPYSYRARFTMPKLIIAASGDQFFLPDSSQFYFNDLPGEKHMLYEANADHSLKGTDVYESIAAFYQSVLDGSKRPNMHWVFEPDGSIKVTMDRTPLTVKLWQETNPEHRDFRVEAIGRGYQSTALTAEGPGVYVARVPKPAKGWTAFYVEATFAGDGKYPLKFTTAVRVLPNVEPYTMPAKGKSKLQPESEAAHY